MENSLIFEILTEIFKNFYYEILKEKESALRMNSSYEEIISETDKKMEEKKKIKTENTTEEINSFYLNSFFKNSLPENVINKFTLIQEKFSLLIMDESSHSKFILSNDDFLQISEARYLMIAFSDETFLKLEWLGYNLWKSNLLETKHFQTQIAGEEIFNRIDALLNENSKRKRGLALIYFYAISLGFSGKYDSILHKEILKNYLKKLFIFIKNESPDYSSEERIFRECYSNNLSKIVNEKLLDVRFFTKIIFFLLLSYFFATYLVWHKSSSEIYEGTEFILKRLKKLEN